MTINHDRIVTPDTDPDRFTEQEADYFRRGICCRTGYGYWGGEMCGRPSRPGASFGYCEEDYAALLEDFWPDGTSRWGAS